MSDDPGPGTTALLEAMNELAVRFGLRIVSTTSLQPGGGELSFRIMRGLRYGVMAEIEDDAGNWHLFPVGTMR